MNLLKCTDWKVSFFLQAPARGMGWGEGGVKVEGLQPKKLRIKLKKKKKKKLPVKKKC